MALLATAAVGSASPPLAAALEPGVHVDPGSPAAKEYAIPLTQARQTGQGGSTRSGSSGTLFGAGIAPKRSPSASAHIPGRAASLESAQDAGRSDPVPGVPASAASGVLARAGSPHGNNSTLALLGGGVLVLVLGAFFGVVLRGRRTVQSN